MWYNKKSKNLLQDESGTATIEAVLWLPVFIAFFCLVADASFIFFGQNKAYRIVQDANRKLSIGRLSTAVEVEQYITTQFASFAPNATIVSDVTSGTVTTAALIPASDLVATGFITSLTNASVTIGASHLVEY